MADVADSTRPNRVQLSRRKGWRMPPNTVSVARPGKWGNPFVIGEEYDRREWGLCRVADRQSAVDCYECLIREEKPWMIVDARRELSGKNLACWCKLSDPCHADVLLELANSPEHPHAD